MLFWRLDTFRGQTPVLGLCVQKFWTGKCNCNHCGKHWNEFDTFDGGRWLFIHFFLMLLKYPFLILFLNACGFFDLVCSKNSTDVFDLQGLAIQPGLPLLPSTTTAFTFGPREQNWNQKDVWVPAKLRSPTSKMQLSFVYLSFCVANPLFCSGTKIQCSRSCGMDL